ncbi:hypothetical protein EZ313_20235 [Ramlibacter henchirensis]|uniref:Uncharacterized protein n=1 Tax=Ramlibacter henchirensis TaxID=204072 RepID=A0A4Z0BN90_9BURK|nr:hypothetical protein [Ramlibacter henchirensis]TFZ00777.1 hypothetical protein EZ313_20235 [Ramlibacter henchirensis]
MGYFIDIASTGGGTGLKDARGCVVGTGSAAAVGHVETALESMLSYFGDPIPRSRRPGNAIRAGPIRASSRPGCCSRWANTSRPGRRSMN